MFDTSTSIRVSVTRRELLRRIASVLALQSGKTVSLDDALGEVTEAYLRSNPQVASAVNPSEAVQA